MIELIGKRQENSKQFRVVSGIEHQYSIGAIHYKDNYADKNEKWKDTTPIWEGNKITKAPYILTRDGNKYTIRDKKSGEVSTIELLTLSSDFEVVPDLDKIKFQHIVDSLPFLAQFKVTGNFRTRAFDDEGEIELQTTLANGILTEVVPSVKDKYTKKVRLLKGKLRIDPTWQVGAEIDNCGRRLTPSSWAPSSFYVQAGADGSSAYRWGSGMRFTNITIPQGDTINQAYLTLRSSETNSWTVVRTRISADDVDDAATFSTEANFDTRWSNRDTSAIVDWDGIGAWTQDEDYDSPEIKTVIQARVDSGTWASGYDIVIFWEDFEDRSDHGVASAMRKAYGYKSSSEFAPKLVITVAAAVEAVYSSMMAQFQAGGVMQ